MPGEGQSGQPPQTGAPGQQRAQGMRPTQGQQQMQQRAPGQPGQPPQTGTAWPTMVLAPVVQARPGALVVAVQGQLGYEQQQMQGMQQGAPGMYQQPGVQGVRPMQQGTPGMRPAPGMYQQPGAQGQQPMQGMQPMQQQVRQPGVSGMYQQPGVSGMYQQTVYGQQPVQGMRPMQQPGVQQIQPQPGMRPIMQPAPAQQQMQQQVQQPGAQGQQPMQQPAPQQPAPVTNEQLAWLVTFPQHRDYEEIKNQNIAAIRKNIERDEAIEYNKQNSGWEDFKKQVPAQVELRQILPEYITQYFERNTSKEILFTSSEFIFTEILKAKNYKDPKKIAVYNRQP